jgi:hypothetical protein
VPSVPIQPRFVAATSEEIVLFRWDGVASTVQDVDYVIWGADLGVRTDKTAVAGYQPDTPVAAQIPVGGGIAASLSYQRARLNEGDEARAGGNGITGRNETSENLASTRVIAAPTPLGSWSQ